MMKVNRWTLGLAAVGLVTLPGVVQSEEKMSAMNTALSSTIISGYVDTSAQWSPGTGGTVPAGGMPAPFAFNTANKQDGFNLNVVNVTIEKPLDPQDNWAAGYKVEMLYGQNAIGYNPTFASGSDNDFGLKQAFVALRAPVGNGIDFKMGVFDTLIGYEVFNAGNNPNFTRSYGYTLEPFQHTGLIASYQFSKNFGIAGGVADTVNSRINDRSTRAETDKSYLGSIALGAPESMGFLAGSTLYGGVVAGQNAALPGLVGAPAGTSIDQNNFYAGVTLNTPLKQLKVGASYDYVAYDAAGSDNSAYANAIGVYASFQATEKLSLHARGEYTSATDMAVYQPGAGGAGTTWGAVGSPNIWAVTGTIQYDLWANVLSRLEVRWDHAEHGAPFNNSDENAFLVAANVIYKF